MKRTYKVKVTKLLTALLFVTLVLSLTLNFALKVAAANNNKVSDQVTMYVVVKDGDTLWELAEKYCPNCDPRKTVYNLKKINRLDNVNIVPGQTLRIPQMAERKSLLFFTVTLFHDS